MGIKTLQIDVIGLKACKRFDGKRLKMSAIFLSLENQDGNISCQSNVRRSNRYFTTSFNETFELGPVQNFATILSIQVLYQAALGTKKDCQTAVCHLHVPLGDRQIIGLREMKESELHMVPGSVNGLHDNPKMNA